jgi:hypothetical protein
MIERALIAAQSLATVLTRVVVATINTDARKSKDAVFGPTRAKKPHNRGRRVFSIHTANRPFVGTKHFNSVMQAHAEGFLPRDDANWRVGLIE